MIKSYAFCFCRQFSCRFAPVPRYQIDRQQRKLFILPSYSVFDHRYDTVKRNLTTQVQSTETNDELFSGKIPVEELQISVSRSSGPGGQHVNKVNTKVEVRFHVESAEWIPLWIRKNIMERDKNKITKEGYLVVTSSKTRKQILNQADCMSKIRTLIYSASYKPREPTEEELAIHAQRKERQRREMLREKREHSLQKKSRKTISDASI